MVKKKRLSLITYFLSYSNTIAIGLFYSQIIGLQNSVGILDEQSKAMVTWNIPNIPALAGYKIYFLYVTVYSNRPMPRLINSISEVKDVTLLS